MVMKTPDWILKGYDCKADWEKAQGKQPDARKCKTYKIKVCPKCKSSRVHVVLVGEEGKKADKWECSKCKWVGRDIQIEELPEEEFLEKMEKEE